MNVNRKWALALLVGIVCAGCENSGPVAHDPANVLTERWIALCEKGGCLCGDSVYRPPGPGEGSSFGDDPEWIGFLDQPSEEVVPFLLTRLASTKSTDVHVCPYAYATEGELAVYVIQQLLCVNWTDYEGERADEFDRAGKRLGQPVQIILADAGLRQELTDFLHQRFVAATTDQGE